ncbi:hypothetical protein ILYODFUR_014950 [Ilyodon furcidens]|uniref:Uncharacterized protein n=1 Tax=Ilyodon furcidens TaxID=33524 RepID=A0ABV0TIS2_9TELE
MVTLTQLFSSLFSPEFYDSNMTDLHSIVSCFTVQCKDILDLTATVKQSTAQHLNCCPWINEEIRTLNRTYCKTKGLWKSSKLEVHRLHLKDLILSLNDLI